MKVGRFLDKKLLLIINPYAGRATIKYHVLNIIDIFVKAGYTVTCYTTQKAGDLTDMVRKTGEGFDRIVCCGGDGTINEGINGIMMLKKRPELGIIPVGTTNDYAYSLSVPSNALKAAEIAANGHCFPIDVGDFNGRHFAYVSAFGILTDVSYQTDQNLKNAVGGLAYFFEGAKRVSAIRSYHMCVEHDGGVIEGDFVVGMFSNAISLAGLRTAYVDALLDDGLLEIALIKRPGKMEDLQDIIDVLLNIEAASSIESDFLTIIHTTKAVVTSKERVAWTVDGESGGEHTKISIRAHQRAITVIAGKDMGRNSVLSETGKQQEATNTQQLL